MHIFLAYWHCFLYFEAQRCRFGTGVSALNRTEDYTWWPSCSKQAHPRVLGILLTTLIAQANILIDSNNKPRITDFGLARTVIVDSQGTYTMSSFDGRGTLRWQAPELLNSSRAEGGHVKLTVKSDVYAFGCVCLEVYMNFPSFRICQGRITHKHQWILGVHWKHTLRYAIWLGRYNGGGD